MIDWVVRKKTVISGRKGTSLISTFGISLKVGVLMMDPGCKKRKGGTPTNGFNATNILTTQSSKKRVFAGSNGAGLDEHTVVIQYWGECK